MKRLFGLLMIISAFLFVGCNLDSLFGNATSSSACIVESVQKYDAAPGQFAMFVITVRNTSDATVFNVGCSVKLKNGNTIIDRGTGSFGSLDPEESAVDEVWFTEITTEADYQSYEITLFWYDENGQYYEG